MIEVWLGKTALTVRGHAGFSRYGSDIVCAAASMLAFALAEAVQAAGLKTPPVIESGCGGFRLEVSADKREQARLDTVRLIPWERVDEADRRWIIDAERREILDRGLLDRPEEPMARYLRAKYPESWARAGEERERQASPRYHKE